VLLFSVSYTRVAIPLFWPVCEAKGCSDDKEKREIQQRIIAAFGRVSFRFVTADRQFVSKAWLEYLTREQIGFRLRIKANPQLTDPVFFGDYRCLLSFIEIHNGSAPPFATHAIRSTEIEIHFGRESVRAICHVRKAENKADRFRRPGGAICRLR
jgi:hypothetical protein